MFGRRFDLFEIFGFRVRVDMSWIVLAILVAWSLSSAISPSGSKISPRGRMTMGILGAAGLFLTIIFHERAHSLVARSFGMPMKGITLFVFGGVAEMGGEPPARRRSFSWPSPAPFPASSWPAHFSGCTRLGCGCSKTERASFSPSVV
jgi:Zn-dependent protease